MPVFNIVSKAVAGVSVTSNTDNSLIISSSVHGVQFITEDISWQIENGGSTFHASFGYVPLSLEVFINGMRMNNLVDYYEVPSDCMFCVEEHDIQLSKVFNTNSRIVIKYIRASS